MKSRAQLVTATVLVVVIFAFIYFTKGPKIAYIDTPRLVSSYAGTIEARKGVEEKISSLRNNLDTLRYELEMAINDYNKNKSKYSASEGLQKEQSIQNKKQQYLMYEESVNKKIGEEQRKLEHDVASKIDLYIKVYGEEHSYDYIIGATTAGNLVYAKKGNEITDDILKGLNKEYNEGLK
jgi:outer membrane protein